MSPNDKKLLHDLPLYQYSSKVRQEWGYTSTPPIWLQDVDRNNHLFKFSCLHGRCCWYYDLLRFYTVFYNPFIPTCPRKEPTIPFHDFSSLFTLNGTQCGYWTLPLRSKRIARKW